MSSPQPAGSLTGALNLQWGTLITEELVRCGVRVCCISPGSRSSPLAVAAARHAGLTNIVHYDERGSAFCALGAARATGCPAVWITTSGSAVANGFPAVVEAAAAGVPLLLLTADRPPELRESGANQTIDQVRLFGNQVRWQFDLPCPSAEIAPEVVLTTIDQAVQRALASPAGPVHLNCMFREPLLPPGQDSKPLPLPDSLAVWRKQAKPYSVCLAADRGDTGPASALGDALSSARRGIIVAGALNTAAERDAVRALAESWHWPLLPDITSGLRLGACTAPRAAFADQLLLGDDVAQALRPDAVLHVGGGITSKRLQQFLAAAAPATYAHVHRDAARLDPAHRVRLRAMADVAACCRALAPRLAGSGDPAWANRWTHPSDAVSREIDQVLDGLAAISEPAVARIISRGIPAGHGLFVASSMPIRDMNMYAAVDGATPLLIANRGASGIDGSVATAAGVAAGTGAPATALVGDLALLHDLNSLPLAARSRRPLTIVVINNDGGGIFSFLPAAAHGDVFTSHFATPHGLHFADAAAMFGLPYTRAETPAQFAAAYRAATAGSRTTLIEVATDRSENLRVHEALQARIHRCLARL